VSNLFLLVSPFFFFLCLLACLDAAHEDVAGMYDIFGGGDKTESLLFMP
jgi:hypothetical protein